MKSRYAFIILLLTFAATSCTEKIEIELDSTYTRLVVDGAIHNQAWPSQISLSYTTDYFSNTQPGLVSNAVVTVISGDQTWLLSETRPGTYHTPANFQGEEGASYLLQIDEVELDGKKQTYSALSTMPKVPPIDSIQVEFQPNWQVWGVKLYAWDPPTKEFYLFRVFCNGVLVSDTIDRWRVVSDEFFNGNYTFGVIAQWLRENEAKVGDTITLEMASVPEDYARFIWEVQEASGYNNPLFSGPPANVRTNIDNGAIGFFATYANTMAHTVIRGK